jgi:uncharacterized protein (TIGR02599 family)
MSGTTAVERGHTIVRRRESRAGVTLVEMLVSVTILFVLMTIIFSIIQITSQAWKKTSQTTTSMQQARVAFERMTRNISQATLNTYYGYYYGTTGTVTSTVPSYYMRQSELQFISGSSPVNGSSFISGTVGDAAQITHAVFFQAPLGVINSGDSPSYGQLSNLLNACGYFVTYCQDPLRPAFLNAMNNQPQNEYRYRLMEMLQPSENLGVYTQGAIPSGGVTVPPWISNAIPNLTTSETSTGTITVRPLANNIVALIIMPEQYSSAASGAQVNTSPLSTQSGTYNYDSAYQASVVTSGTQTLTGNQLPPLVKVVMVAIDEASAIKLAAANGSANTLSTPNLGQSTLFSNPSLLFTNGSTKGDLDKFQDVLNAVPGNISGNAIKLNYYIFQTDVLIRGAKWTNS